MFSIQMATVERKTRSTEGVQKEKLLASSEEDSPSVVNDTSSQLNFSELTPCQFGISVQSFTPASLSKSKGEMTDPFLMATCCHFIYIALQSLVEVVYKLYNMNNPERN